MDLYSIIIMTVLLPTVTTIVKELFSGLNKYISIFIERLFMKRKTKIKLQTYRRYTTHGDRWDNADSITNLLIEGILQNLDIKNMEEFNGELTFHDPYEHTSSTAYEYKKQHMIAFLPTNKILYKDMYIRYNKDIEYNDKKEPISEKCTMIITSDKSIEHVNKELRCIYDDYIKKIYDIPFQPSFYKQYPYKNGIRFKKYNLSNKTTFDSLFLNEKDSILEMLEKLKGKDLQKLAFLLHGEPGCGKTSLIKAIANYLGYSIIELKLSFMKNDADLFNAFHTETVAFFDKNDEGNTIKVDIVPVNKRIYILEDIDAETDIVHKRHENADNFEDDDDDEKDKITKMKEINETSLYEKMMEKFLQKGITLSGILNSLDGILEINGSVIILSTNHVDKLDPALIRPGRISMILKMQKMTNNNANSMIKKYFNNDASLNIQDNVFTPALLESFCQQANSIDELKKTVENYQQDTFLNIGSEN